MTIFTPAQMEDLREIQALCQAKGTDIVIVGAMAYRLFIHDVDRETRDIDLAVAINHEDIEPFYGAESPQERDRPTPIRQQAEPLPQLRAVVANEQG